MNASPPNPAAPSASDPSHSPAYHPYGLPTVSNHPFVSTTASSVVEPFVVLCIEPPLMPLFYQKKKTQAKRVGRIPHQSVMHPAAVPHIMALLRLDLISENYKKIPFRQNLSPITRKKTPKSIPNPPLTPSPPLLFSLQISSLLTFSLLFFPLLSSSPSFQLPAV